MPLVRISLLAGKPELHKRKVSEAVHRALIETISIPAEDRFHIITEPGPADFIYDPEYLKIHRTNDLGDHSNHAERRPHIGGQKVALSADRRIAQSGSRPAQRRCVY